MGTKDRNYMYQTEAEDIKKRWQEYTEELCKKDLHDSDNHDGVITHLKPDILEWEVKWALGSITMNKGSGSDGIPVELFQILKDDAMKVLHSIYQQILKTQQWLQDWKRSVFIPIPKKGNAKECSNYCTIALISQASKVMLKILQARLQHCVNQEIPDVQVGFRKGRGTRDSQHLLDHQKNKKILKKPSISALLTTPKPLTVWITTNCGKFLQIGIPDDLSCLLRNLYAGQEVTVKTGHGTMDWFQTGKGIHQGCAYLTYMQSTS